MLPALCFAVAAAAGCRSSENSLPVAAGPKEAPVLSLELQEMAQKLLGPKVRVVLDGDLAHNGRRQLLLIDPAEGSSGKNPSATVFWRAAVLEQQSTGWTEVLRCDEYLKNSSGYLRGTPRQPVSGWELRWGPEDKNRGHELSFTPLQVQSSEHVPTIKVRWNPNVNRYQSVELTTQTFQTEIPLLEAPASELR